MKCLTFKSLAYETTYWFIGLFFIKIQRSHKMHFLKIENFKGFQNGPKLLLG
jgi:hypothetical protein